LLGALGGTIDEVRIELDQAEVHQNPLYLKALQILHTAKDDAELSCYIEALKIVQKALKHSIGNNQ
jgi:hypothetical protein